MEDLRIEPSKKTPTVHISANEGLLEMEGMSSSENSMTFYKPILEYLDTANKSSTPVTHAEMYFKYFNTSSAKCILDVLERFADLNDAGTDVVVNWYYEEMDEEMMSSGENFAQILDLDINLIEKAPSEV